MLFFSAGMLLHDFSPQNAGLFGHNPMLSGGMPGEFPDSKSNVLGLNLVSSDFSNGCSNNVHPQQLQQLQQMQQTEDSYYVPSNQSDLPGMSIGNRPSSPVGDGRVQSDDAICKGEKPSDTEQEQPHQHDPLSEREDSKPSKVGETAAIDKSTANVSLPPKREPKQGSHDGPILSSKSAKCSNIQGASPTKAASTSVRATSTPESLSTESEKRARSEMGGTATTSPHKRQRVVV